MLPVQRLLSQGGQIALLCLLYVALAATVENRQKEKRKKKYFTSHRGETNLTKEKRKFHQPLWRTDKKGEKKKDNFTVERRI